MDVEAVETVSDEQIATMAGQIFGTNDAGHPGVATFTALGNQLVAAPFRY